MSSLCDLLDQSLFFRIALTVAFSWLALRVVDRLLRRREDQPAGS
jgi:hypothetical protein